MHRESVYNSFKDRKTSSILSTTVPLSHVIDIETTSVVDLVENRVTSTPAMVSEETESTENPLHWPFTVGVVVASVLLVLIVIVSLLLVFVVSMRRGDVEQDKFGTERESDNLFNVVSAATRHRASQGGSSIEMLGKLILDMLTYCSAITHIHSFIQDANHLVARLLLF